MAEHAPRALLARIVSRILLAVGTGIVVLVALHAPWLQDRVGAWGLDALRRFGIDARASHIRYNLLRLRVHADDVVLARSGAADEPFARLASVDLTVRSSVIAGRLALESVQADAIRITLVRHADGSTNWPSAESPADRSAASPFPIGSLNARSVAVAWRDDSLHSSIDIEDATIELAPGPRGAEGSLVLVQPARIVYGDHGTAFTGRAQLAWNGTRLTIDALRLQSAEAGLDASGAIDLLTPHPQLAIDYDGQVDLARLGPWLTLDPQPTGVVGARGRVSGPLAAPVVEAAVTSAGARWHDITASAVDVAMKLDAKGVDIDRASMNVAGGTVRARAHVAFGGDAAGRLAMDWTGIDGGLLIGAMNAARAVRLATRVDGRANASWSAWRADAVTLSADARMRPDRSPGRANLAGSLSMQASGGRWRAAIDQSIEDALRVHGTVGGRLSDSLPQSTVTGEVAATTDAADRLWSVLRQVDAVPAATAPVEAGRVRADLFVAGTIAAPTADVSLTVSGWTQQPVGAVDLEGHVGLSTLNAAIDRVTARIGANTLEGRGVLSFADGRIDARVDATLPALDQLLPRSARSLHASGTLRATATIGGRLRAPLVDGRVTAQHLSVAGQQADRLDATFGLHGNVLQVDRLELSQAGGGITGNGSFDLKTRAVSASVNAHDVAVAPVPGGDGGISAPVRAILDAAVSIAGTLDDPRGEGRIELRDARWQERRLGRISAALALSSHRLRADLQAPDLYASATATMDADPHGRFSVDAAVTGADLERLTSLLVVRTEAPVTGHTTFGAHVDGRLDQLARSRVTIDLQQLDASVNGIPVRVVRSARAAYDERSLDIGDLLVGVGESRIHVAGRLDREGAGTLTASLDGGMRDLSRVVNSFGRAGALARAELDGRVNVEARVTGRIDRPSIDATLRLDEGRIAAGRLPPATGITVRASYGAGLVDVSQADGAWQGATVSASGRVPLALLGDSVPAFLRADPSRTGQTAHVNARFGQMTPEMLAPWLPADTLRQIEGLVSATLTLDAAAPTIESVRGQLVFDDMRLAIAGVRFDERSPTRFELANGRARIADWEWGTEKNLLSVTGSIPLDTRSAIDLSASGTFDLRALGAFSADISTAGQAAVRARVTGHLDAPRIDARADILDGEFRAPAAGLTVSGVTGAIVLAADELTVSDVYGTANGGTLTIAGRARYGAGQGINGRLSLTGRGIAMAIPSALRSEVDADLSLGIERDLLSLSGEVIVQRGAYREPLSLAGGLVQALQQPAVSVNAGPVSAIDRMTLDIRVTTADDIFVDNNYARGSIGADLRVRGTVAQPALLGRVEAREGSRIFLGGNVYRLERSGSVDFVNPSRIEPDVNITASTRVSGYEVNLSLKGPLSRLETRLVAPGSNLTESQVAVLLATGSPPVQGAAVPAVGRDQLLAFVSGEFLGAAGRAIGVDTLRLEQGSPDVRFDAGLIATEADPGSRLTFGKQVTRQFEVVFSKNLKDTGAFIWIVGYRPRPNIELRVVSEENNDRIYEFGHDVTVGGAAATTPSPPSPRPTIVAVRFDSVSGIVESDLRGRLKLTEGKRFDFDKWQQDRDRLEALCRDRGRLEAHVTARRANVERDGESGVELQYDVRCGPATTIDITGAPDEAALRGAIERVWIGSVFDTVLVDETRHLARAALVRDRYLQSTLAVSMDAANDRKRLIVSIDRGPRSDARRLAFEGNEQITTGRLEALVSAQRLTDAAWADPARLVRAVAAFYRDEGYASARIVVGQPVFDGAKATLPVRIDEGPVLHIERVDVAGATAQTPDELLRIAGLEPGGVLTRAQMERAASAVERDYLSRGFTAVRVTLTSRSEATPGRAAVTVTVDEGPRQVVREVTIEGTRRTNQAFVGRALRVAPGQPVNLSDWAQARKRLFDTGAYRQVDVEAVPITEATPGDHPAGEQPVRASVRVEEWPPFRFRYGFEVDEHAPAAGESRTFRPGVAADATFRNLFGPLSMVIAGRYTGDFRAARGLLTAPTFFGLPLTSNLFVERSRERVGPSERPFAADKTDFTAEQRFRLRNRLQIAYSYNFERNHTFDLNANPDDPFAFDVTVNIARLTGTGIRDTRDDLVDAKQGQFFSATIEHGGSLLGSDLHFSKFFAVQSYYRTLPFRLVFATNGRLGLAAAYGQELIPGERFYAGGGNSVRGYEEDSLGPRDFFGDPVGGNALLVLNEELRFPIAWWVRGVAFFDAGNAFQTIGDIALGDLRTSAGAGLRVRTPFALFRIDIGAPLGRRAGEPRSTWFFSIGQVF